MEGDSRHFAFGTELVSSWFAVIGGHLRNRGPVVTPTGIYSATSIYHLSER
jgi:hypothetical protein